MAGARNLGVQRARLGLEPDEFRKEAAREYRDSPELGDLSIEAFEHERAAAAASTEWEAR